MESGLVTCHWHHARFDLVSGCTLDLWADDARGFDVELADGDVFVRAAGRVRCCRPSAAAPPRRPRGGHLARDRQVGARAARRGRRAGRRSCAPASSSARATADAGWGAGLTTLDRDGEPPPPSRRGRPRARARARPRVRGARHALAVRRGSRSVRSPLTAYPSNGSPAGTARFVETRVVRCRRARARNDTRGSGAARRKPRR